MLQPLHLRDYTRELKKRLPARVFKPVPARLLWIIPHLLLIGAAVAAIGLLDLHPLWMLLLSGLIGHSFACFGFLAHEVLHGGVARTVWARQLTGWVCFAPFLVSPSVWRRWHNVEHHGHTQHPEDDPDTMATLEQYRERPALQRFYRMAPVLRSFVTFAGFSIWFSMHSWMMTKRFWGSFDRRKRRTVLAEFAFAAGMWAVLLALLGPVRFLFAYLIPLGVGNAIVMSYIATNHLLNPLSDVNDPLITSLSLKKPRLIDWLHLRFSAHTEHHIFPNVSSKFAPQIKVKIKEIWPDRYRELPHWQALRLLWKTPRLYYNAKEFIDPKLALIYPVLGSGLHPRNVQPRPQTSGDAD